MPRISNPRVYVTGAVTAGLIGFGGYKAHQSYTSEPGRGNSIEACPYEFEPNVNVYDDTSVTLELLTTDVSQNVADGFATESNTPGRQLPDLVRHAGELICSISNNYSSVTWHYLLPAGEIILIQSGVTRAETEDLPDGMGWRTVPKEWRNPLDPILAEQS